MMGLFPSLFLKAVQSGSQVYIRKQYIDLKNKKLVVSKSIQ